EPIFKHVSVPGTYQKPAPYRLQTFTYSTGLALTGRSAACAPATATRPAAEPRSRLLTIRIDEPSSFAFRVGSKSMCPPSGRGRRLFSRMRSHVNRMNRVVRPSTKEPIYGGDARRIRGELLPKHHVR